MESLKEELLQAQKTRDDLMKWKLLLVSGIGAAALGFSKSSAVSQAELALCLIPLACCYVDLLCRNLSIRTKLLSRFLSEELQGTDSAEARFECFYQAFNKTRTKEKKEDALEGFALIVSTLVLSIAIIPVGIAASKIERLCEWPSPLFVIAGVAGLLFSWLIHWKYRIQRDLIEDEQRPREWYAACAEEDPANPTVEKDARKSGARPSP